MKTKNIKKTLLIFLVSSFLILVIVPGTTALFSEKANTKINLNVEAPTFTVTFDPNGGTTSLASKDIGYGHEYGELPTADKCGSTFLGWYTGLTDGIKIESTSTFNMLDDQTLYARYENSNELYDVLKCEAERTDILNADKLAGKYSGNHQDSMDASLSTREIYHTYASSSTKAGEALEFNNVIFANQCWQMIRTTDTGGVKLIYNGEAEDGKCLTTRGNHVGYTASTVTSLSGTYYFGTDYTYDATSNSFSLSGTIESVDFSGGDYSSIPSLIGKYTCKKNTSDGTCNPIYLLESSNGGSSVYVATINKSSHYSQYGTISFNDYMYDSPAYSGYMFNDVYQFTTNSQIKKYTSIQNGTITMSESWYYSSTIDYGNNVVYQYTLTNPLTISSLQNKQNLVGKYILSTGGNDSSTRAYYIVKVDGTKLYYYTLLNGNLGVSVVMGNSYTKNNDGTYTVINKNGSTVTTVKYETWYNSTNRSSYANKYLCVGESDTCNELRHITNKTPSETGYDYLSTDYVYKFGEKVSYLNGEYTLSDDIIEIWDFNDSTEVEKISTHHYTCMNNTLACTPKVYFITSFDTYNNIPFYLEIRDAEDIDAALVNLLSVYTNDKKVNTKNSIIKIAIDAWYKKYIYNYYDSYVEDTIYCNDRSIKNFGAFSENGAISGNLNYKESTVSSDLSCTNDTDKFSTLNNKAQLTYKVGLATSPEMYILGNSNLKKTGYEYWLASPDYFGTSQSMRYIARSTGGIGGSSHVRNKNGVRPVISLISGIKYASGDGSTEHPYIIKTVGPYTTSAITFNSPLPANIETYMTPQEAMESHVDHGATEAKPFYLRYNKSGDNVSEIYLEFVITEEMANNNTGYTAGTYSLKGGIAEWSSSKPVLTSNRNTLLEALGSNCTYSDYNVSCSFAGHTIGANDDGQVGVYNSTWGCAVNESGGGCGSYGG